MSSGEWGTVIEISRNMRWIRPPAFGEQNGKLDLSQDGAKKLFDVEKFVQVFSNNFFPSYRKRFTVMHVTRVQTFFEVWWLTA